MAAPKRGRKIIRNLHPIPLTLRLGSSRDPFHINLARRGTPGDYVEVSPDLTEHPQFTRNVNVTFEVISAAEAGKIEYHMAPSRTASESDEYNVTLERMEDKSTTVATVELDDKGRPKFQRVTAQESRNPARSNAPGTVDRAAQDAEAMPDVSPPLPTNVTVERVKS